MTCARDPGQNESADAAYPLTSQDGVFTTMPGSICCGAAAKKREVLLIHPGVVLVCVC